MTASPHDIGVVVLAFALVGIVVVAGLIWAGKWAMRREADRTAAATFEADFIPTASDVAAQESAIAQDVWVAQVGEIQADVEAALAGLRGTA